MDPAVLAYDGEPLRRLCKENIEPFYSDFITRFTVDLARYIIPNCRALSISSMFEGIFNTSFSKLQENTIKHFSSKDGASLPCTIRRVDK